MTTDPRQLAQDLLAGIQADIREHGLTLDRDEDSDAEGDGDNVGLSFRGAPIASVLGSDNFSCLQEENEDGIDERERCDVEALALARLFAAAPILATALLAALDERDAALASVGLGSSLYAGIVKRLEPHFTPDARDLEWDVLPGTIGALARERDDLRAHLRGEPGSISVADAALVAQHDVRCHAGMVAALDEMRDERDELRLNLAAEQGRAEGAPSEGWKPNYSTGQFPSYQWRKTFKNGERVTVDYFPVERRWEWCFMDRPNRENFPAVRERFRTTARAAMQAVDAALSGSETTSPSQPARPA